MRSLFGGKTKVLLIFIVILVMLIAVSVLILNNKNSDETEKATESNVTTITVPENKSTTYENTTVTETKTSVNKNSTVFPKEIQVLLENHKEYKDTIIENNCSQLIVVDTKTEKALVNYYSLVNGEWNKNEELSCTAFMGKNGSTANKKEGDGCTPLGLYKINSGFYIYEKPQTELDLFKVTENSYWVDDVNSAFYNQYVTDISKKDWNSAEHMIEYSGYRYGFVVDYNPTCEPNAGSAIFFHVGYNPTAGCIATDEQMVLKYMSVLDKNENPFVLIV